MKFPFGTRSKTMMALALPAGLVLMASLLVTPTPPAMAQTAVATPSGNGYWLVATDGGIFAYGDAGFFGSLGDRVLNKPITGMVPTPTGNGYWLVASDGGIFAFGDADFFGSAGGIALNKPIVGMANSGEEAGFSAAGAKGAPGPAGTRGDVGPAGPPGLAAEYVGPNWGVVHRNVMGNGYADLGASTQTPPLGVGALNIRTNLGVTDKAAFGNEKDFFGQPVLGLVDLGFSVFTTGENIAKGADNMPSLLMEIDPNLTSTATNFSSLVYTPPNTAANAWSTVDADSDSVARWFMTGDAGIATGCTLATPCTFATVKTKLGDGGDAPIIYTVQVTKGRDNYTFSGAVDALVVNSRTFDFEPWGVRG